TLLAVEQDDDEITTFLQDYIRRKSNEYTQERPAIDESSAIDERSVIRERPLAAVNNKISDNAHKINECNINADLESNEIEEEIEEEIEQENEITNLNNMKNPNKVTSRGRSHKRRYLSSVEKEQGLRGKPKTRGSYKCRVCQQVGHNTTFYKST
ncbi:12125_t:CDS:1, partial [Cetraspora pellucida]